MGAEIEESFFDNDSGNSNTGSDGSNGGDGIVIISVIIVIVISISESQLWKNARNIVKASIKRRRFSSNFSLL